LFGEILDSIFKAVFIIIILAAFSCLLAFPFKWSWNYVIPYLFELKYLSWGQAWCLIFISGFLFKSIHTHNK